MCSLLTKESALKLFQDCWNNYSTVRLPATSAMYAARSPNSGKMGPLLFGLLAAYIAEVAGLRSVPVELSSQDRDALFKGLNDIRASLGSSNMECLTKWSTELEAEAQKVASECTAKEEEGAHGVAVIYQTPPSPPTPAPPPAPTAPAAPAISTYLDVIKSYKTTLKPDCTCVATKEANCGTFKQFSLWNAGQVGCAVSKCSTPTQTSYVMACVFDKWAKRDKCSFSAGTECSFCLEGKRRQKYLVAKYPLSVHIYHTLI